MKQFSNTSDVVKYLLNWKRKNRLSLKFLYNVKIIHTKNGYAIRFDEALNENGENGLKFYLDYIAYQQKKLFCN